MLNSREGAVREHANLRTACYQRRSRRHTPSELTCPTTFATPYSFDIFATPEEYAEVESPIMVVIMQSKTARRFSCR